MILLSQETGFLKPIAWLLGQILNGLFNLVYALDTSLFKNVNLPILGICVILFTVVVRVLMLPLTMKSQRFSKLSSLMNPELQAIQAKYKGKRDQESMLKQQAETKAVYEKYGASPSAGCLPMLIQLPIMFALYRVIYKVPGYVTHVKNICTKIHDSITGVDGYADILDKADLSIYDSTTKFIDKAYNFTADKWDSFAKAFDGTAAHDVITSQSDKLLHMTNFFGINLNEAPGWVWSWALLIPLLAGVTQYLSTQLAMAKKDQTLTQKNDDNPMGNSMKTMNYIMPLISVFFCITLPACIGIYWITGSVFQIVQQLIINKQMDNVDLETLVQNNIDKVNAKRAKKGLPPKKIENTASTYVEEVRKHEARVARKEDRDKEIQNSTDYYNRSTAKQGSLAAKANMVKLYNERNKSSDKKDEK